MLQILNQNRRFFISFLLIIIVFVYIVDIQLYFNTENKLEQKVLYFPAQTTSTAFLPELRNIPLISPLRTGRSVYDSSFEVFLVDLFLGPQSIYNRNPNHQFLRLKEVLYHQFENRNVAFIFLEFEDSVNAKNIDLSDNEKIKEIKQWILFNTRKYYDIDFITVFIDNVAI